MPKQIYISTTVDAIEREVIYTRAALLAQDESKALLERTDSWLEKVEQLRAAEKKLRMREAEVEASRITANQRLNETVTEFGDYLWLQVRKDKASPNWTRFFSNTISYFLRQPLADRVAAVRGWLSIDNNAALDTYKARLERWQKAAQKALEDDAEVSTLRSNKASLRQQIAHALTNERDALHDALSAIARESNFSRGWADAFFAVTVRKTKDESDAPKEPASSDQGTDQPVRPAA